MAQLAMQLVLRVRLLFFELQLEPQQQFERVLGFAVFPEQRAENSLDGLITTVQNVLSAHL